MERLGITDKKIRSLRTRGVEVTTAKGVIWPLADAQALAEGLGVVLEPAEKNGAPDGTEEVVVCSTARGQDGRHFPNRNIIMCRRSTGEVVTVRVFDSSKYRPFLRVGGAPMVLRARPSGIGSWWINAGREPRWPAQW